MYTYTYTHSLLLYNQACSLNRKRLEQLHFQQSTSSTFTTYCVGAQKTELHFVLRQKVQNDWEYVTHIIGLWIQAI